MTTVHVLPTGETPEHHTLGNCPCQPRLREIRREGETVETVTLHRPLDSDHAN